MQTQKKLQIEMRNANVTIVMSSCQTRKGPAHPSIDFSVVIIKIKKKLVTQFSFKFAVSILITIILFFNVKVTEADDL